MGSSPFSDKEDQKMMEQSLRKSAQTLRPYLIYAWEDMFLPFGNWCLNFIGLFMLIISSVSTTIARFALKNWVTLMEKLGRRRIIMDRVNDEPYLERYYIFMKDRSEQFPFNIFIHKFLKSDPDDLHDHPWGFFTFIIAIFVENSHLRARLPSRPVVMSHPRVVRSPITEADLQATINASTPMTMARSAFRSSISIRYCRI